VSAAELANHFAQAALAGESKKAVHYAALAGEDATRALAYGEAVAHYERAIAVLDLVGGSESERAELLLDLGAAHTRAGDRNAAHADIMRAVELARRTSRKDVLASAALALRSLGGLSGTADNERVLLLEEARAALGDEQTALRARVLAGLAQERYHSWLHLDESEHAAELAAEAVELARRLDDPATLAAALLARHDARWLPGHEQERLEIAHELAQVARMAGDRELATESLLLQATAMIELSDARAVSRLEEFVHVAEELHQARFNYLAATRHVTLSLISGDTDAFNSCMETARLLARAQDEPDAFLVESVQIGGHDMLVGQHVESVELARGISRAGVYEELLLILEALAGIEQGDAERAREIVRTIDMEGAAPRYMSNYGWLYLLANLAELVARLGDADLVAETERWLAPHAGKCVVIAGGVSFVGSVSHYLGLLYAASGRPAEAKAAFEDALAAYHRLGAEGWAQRTRHAMAGLEVSTEDDAPAQLTREGPFWTLRYGGETCRVKDAKGIRDLALLVTSPNREVAAAELMAHGMAAEAGGADAVLDDRARRQFRERLADLEADRAEAEAANDLGRIGNIKDERDALAHELAAALGLGGRARALGDPAERARKAVSARIRDAVKAIGVCHATLGDHLQASVRTGTFCSYAPASPVQWRVTDDTPR
jgi:tetratricopeptide (TPR) repeat protein